MDAMDQILKSIFGRVRLVCNFIEEILSVERRTEENGLANIENVSNIFNDFRRCRRRQTQYGNIGKLSFEDR